MKVTKIDRNGYAVLRLEGEFDTFETEQVRDRFSECVAEGRTRVIFDLEKVTFANSTTIAYLISAMRKAREVGGTIVLLKPREFLRSTFKTLGRGQIFRIYDDMDEAVAALEVEDRDEKG